MLRERIRILIVDIVDDHLAVAEGLHALLSREPDFALTEIATNGDAALRIAAAQKPDVILMDQNLSGESGVALAGSILSGGARTSVVMFSGGMTQDELVAAVEAGVSGYLMKTTPVADIVRAMPQLTPREREVLALMAQANDVQRIAEQLRIRARLARGVTKRQDVALRHRARVPPARSGAPRPW